MRKCVWLSYSKEDGGPCGMNLKLHIFLIVVLSSLNSANTHLVKEECVSAMLTLQ